MSAHSHSVLPSLQAVSRGGVGVIRATSCKLSMRVVVLCYWSAHSNGEAAQAHALLHAGKGARQEADKRVRKHREGRCRAVPWQVIVLSALSAGLVRLQP